MRTGSFGMSTIAITTAFGKDDAAFNNPAFRQFVANRDAMKNRLDGERGVSHPLNNQDVLIPAFLAAYTGQDVSTASTFPLIPLPNWKVNYAGLAKIEWIKEYVKTLNITHAYSATYEIGNYTSSLLYGASAIRLDISERDAPMPVTDAEGNLSPVYVINQVNIREQFAPFFGFNIGFQNNWQFRFDYKKSRQLTLNLSNAQVSELLAEDFVVDVGYTKAGVRLPFKFRGVTQVLENDLSFRMAFTVKDSKTIQRKIDEDGVVTAGNYNYQHE